MASVGASLMCNGSGFQRVGAATVKDLSPQVRFFALWVNSRRFAFSDLREREGTWRLIRSQRYWGAWLLRDLRLNLLVVYFFVVVDFKCLQDCAVYYHTIQVDYVKFTFCSVMQQ